MCFNKNTRIQDYQKQNQLMNYFIFNFIRVQKLDVQAIDQACTENIITNVLEDPNPVKTRNIKV